MDRLRNTAVNSLLFIGAGAGAGQKKYAEPVQKKIPGAGQKWTGSATLLLTVLKFVNISCYFLNVNKSYFYSF